jgi:hypothetical protein
MSPTYGNVGEGSSFPDLYHPHGQPMPMATTQSDPSFVGNENMISGNYEFNDTLLTDPMSYEMDMGSGAFSGAPNSVLFVTLPSISERNKDLLNWDEVEFK